MLDIREVLAEAIVDLVNKADQHLSSYVDGSLGLSTSLNVTNGFNASLHLMASADPVLVRPTTYTDTSRRPVASYVAAALKKCHVPTEVEEEVPSAGTKVAGVAHNAPLVANYVTGTDGQELLVSISETGDAVNRVRYSIAGQLPKRYVTTEHMGSGESRHTLTSGAGRANVVVVTGPNDLYWEQLVGAAIDRLTILDMAHPCKENKFAIESLGLAMAASHDRQVRLASTASDVTY
jgi:hypothetical protein